MKKYLFFNKKLLLFIVLIFFALFYSFNIIENLSSQIIDNEKSNYAKRAHTHFKTIVDMRRWNSSLHGLYALQTDTIRPNPYLVNNILKIDENRTFVRINSAWMTRMVSDISDNSEFNFRIVSDKPLNPNNMASNFDREAIDYLNIHQEKEEYYRFKEDEFDYLGVLKVETSCIKCHANYQVGDIRGGISLTLNTDSLVQLQTTLHNQDNVKKFILAVITILLIALFYFILHYATKEQKLNNVLERRIVERTQEIEKTKILLENVLNCETSFIIVLEDNDFLYINDTVSNFFNLKSLEDFRQMFTAFSNFFEKKIILSKDIEHKNADQFLNMITNQKDNDCQCILEKNGEKHYFRPMLKTIYEDKKNLQILILHEITQSVHQLNELNEIATHDNLTNLANRMKCNQVMDELFQKFVTSNTPLSILFVDIDHFKEVNDTFGHDIGDITLVHLSKILKACTRKGDLVSRWGGEEFILILNDSDNTSAMAVAEKLRKSVETTHFKVIKNITISIGVSTIDKDDTQDTLVKRADNALYEAKNSGRNRVVFKSV